ncbi:hypothetical protein JQ554_15310 [Bradyrhizobium diazoefficiens]|nr:hypothetical protein [Bradyrhizobium diazoefficiens]MBR0965660.1 hypothetical protein [Bradyrhizobium diazoefficiens]MBR0979352.1 hypothetical protein [Bradyrhizobium diazoefficiens]MBR1008544.1 hypothetical protein [Bradyrhizobium diazoefficiens]MBR1014707.1 hypothetical protein [Bradyrhizobium diazoefficiens]MBR1052505.1 hypothetical protein [Bradyrhizobium diazoefficiens]
MSGTGTTVLGLEIPSSDPVFLSVVLVVHIPLGLACLAFGAMAMLSPKRRGRHSRFGAVYFGCLLALVASATFLSVLRWHENYHLFILGAASFGCAWFGRTALRQRWRSWVRLHIAGMGMSYILILIAFYVDNGRQLPLWRDLPPFMYWLIPLILGLPLIARSVLWHPLTHPRAT